jgi:uncharacterized protein YecT (DUF1311 family)
MGARTVKSVASLGCVLAMSLALAAPALAGAVEECMTAGDHSAVTRCLTEQDVKANAELAAAEAAAGKRAREIEQATAHAGVHAALAKSMRDFAQYRTSQCAYVKESYASGTGASQAQLGCRVDLTRRRIRDLKP